MSPEGAQWFLHPVLEAHAFGTHEMTTNFSTPSKASDKTPSRVLMCFLQRDEERFSFDWHFRTLWFWVCKCAETHGSPDAQGLLLGYSLNVAAHASWSVRRLALLYCPLNRSGVFKRSYNIFRLTGYNNSISPGFFFLVKIRTYKKKLHFGELFGKTNRYKWSYFNFILFLFWGMQYFLLFLSSI